MAGYIFIPIPTPEMLNFAHDWQEGQGEKRKIPYVILSNRHVRGVSKGFTRILHGGCLRVVTSTDKLYVMAHGPGSTGGRFIGAQRDGVMKKYNAEDLAKLLGTEGLTKSIQDVRIYACGSGAVFAGDGSSYVQRVKLAMGGLGYRSVRVTGYLGDIRPSYAPRALPPHGIHMSEEPHKGVYDEEEGTIFPAHTRRVTF